MEDHENNPNEAPQETPQEAPPAPAPAPEPQYVPPPVVHHPPRPSNPYEKTPLLAGLLSVVPGLGNIYNGLYARGIAFFVSFVGVFFLAVSSGQGNNEEELALLIPSLGFVWLFNIFDAYRQATLINYGYPEMPEKPRRHAPGGLVAGVFVFLVGAYGWARENDYINVGWLVDNWYLIAMLFGAWLIGHTVWRNLRQGDNTPSDSSYELQD